MAYNTNCKVYTVILRFINTINEFIILETTGSCKNSPCQNGGICTNDGSDFDCDCPDDYDDGDTCSECLYFFKIMLNLHLHIGYVIVH